MNMASGEVVAFGPLIVSGSAVDGCASPVVSIDVDVTALTIIVICMAGVFAVIGNVFAVSVGTVLSALGATPCDGPELLGFRACVVILCLVGCGESVCMIDYWYVCGFTGCLLGCLCIWSFLRLSVLMLAFVRLKRLRIMVLLILWVRRLILRMLILLFRFVRRRC